MKLTEEEVFSIIKELKPTQFKLPDVNQLTNHFAKLLKIEPSNKLSNEIKIQLKNFKRKQQSQAHKGSQCRPITTSSNNNFVLDSKDFEPLKENHDENLPEPKAKRRKSFQELGQRMMRNRTDELLETLKDFIASESNDVKIDNTLSLNQVLGYFLYRVNHNSDKKISEMGRALFEKQDITIKPEFDLGEAVALMHDLTLTKQQMRTMKAYLSSKGLFFPNTNDLLEARKKLCPTITPQLDGDGVSVDYIKLVEMTTTSLINILNESSCIDHFKPVHVVYKDGGDGAGSQTVWKSKSMSEASDHLFQYSIVPLRVEQGTGIIWKNATPNSASSTRPVFLLRAEEDEERVLELVVPTTDAAREQLKQPRELFDDNSNIYTVTHYIHDSMKDLKFKKNYQDWEVLTVLYVRAGKQIGKMLIKSKRDFQLPVLLEARSICTSSLWKKVMAVKSKRSKVITPAAKD